MALSLSAVEGVTASNASVAAVQAQRHQRGAQNRRSSSVSTRPIETRRPPWSSSGRGPKLLRRLRHRSQSEPGGRRHNALAWHESLTDDVQARDDAVGDEKAGDRVGAGPLPRRRLRAGDDVRPHDRRGTTRCSARPEIRFSNVGPPLIMPLIIGLKRPASCSSSVDPSTRRRRFSTGW